jgi:hypothetical protein
LHIFVHMKYKSLITVSTIAKTGEVYPIWENGITLIGEAEFLNKEGDFFVFEIQLLQKRNIKNYDFKFTIDAITNELFALRAIAN